MKLKAIDAKENINRQPGESKYSCSGCLGNKSEKDCVIITDLAIEQELTYCTLGCIYVLEDK